jgi:hypothetical protein
MLEPIHGMKICCGAGVPPVISQRAPVGKIAGGTPAPQKTESSGESAGVDLVAAG